MTDPVPTRPLEPIPLPSWKIRPWLKWILYPLLAFPLMIPLLLVASMVFSFLGNGANHAPVQDMSYPSLLQQAGRSLRVSFHDHPDQSALTLDEMKTKNLLSEADAHFFARYPHEFVPFTPQTPDDAIVLTVHGDRPEPDRFTKRDLTADPAAPLHLPASSPAPPGPSPVP